MARTVKKSVRKHTREVEHKRSENILILSVLGVSILTIYGISQVLGGIVTQEAAIQYDVVMKLTSVIIGLSILIFMNRIHESLIVLEEKLD